MIDPLLLVASMGLAFVVTGGTLGVIGDRAYSYSLTRTGTAFYFVGMADPVRGCCARHLRLSAFARRQRWVFIAREVVEAPLLSPCPGSTAPHCGQRLKYQVVERGDWFGIEPTATRCPQCGSSVLRNGETMTVMPRGR